MQAETIPEDLFNTDNAQFCMTACGIHQPKVILFYASVKYIIQSLIIAEQFLWHSMNQCVGGCSFNLKMQIQKMDWQGVCYADFSQVFYSPQFSPSSSLSSSPIAYCYFLLHLSNILYMLDATVCFPLSSVLWLTCCFPPPLLYHYYMSTNPQPLAPHIDPFLSRISSAEGPYLFFPPLSIKNYFFSPWFRTSALQGPGFIRPV